MSMRLVSFVNERAQESHVKTNGFFAVTMQLMSHCQRVKTNFQFFYGIINHLKLAAYTVTANTIEVIAINSFLFYFTTT